MSRGHAGFHLTPIVCALDNATTLNEDYISASIHPAWAGGVRSANTVPGTFSAMYGKPIEYSPM